MKVKRKVGRQETKLEGKDKPISPEHIFKSDWDDVFGVNRTI